MITPNKVHEILKKYILTDGFSHVADLKESQDSWFVDARDGKRYLDCYSMHAAMPLGWNNKKVHAQKERLYDVVEHNPSNSDCYTSQFAQFVETFASITPDFHHYFFVSGGTLGVENALKAAFDWKAQLMGIEDHHANNLDVIHMTNAFHGRSGYTLSLTNTGETKTKWYPKFPWTRLISPATNLWGGQIAHVERTVLNKIEERLKSGLVAAVILEPIQGEGGDNHYRTEFMKELRLLTLMYGTVLIIDEVQTGVGLTGKMWGYKHYDIVPDMICFGKKTQVCGFCSTNFIDSIQDNVFKVSGRINSTWGGNLVDMVRSTIYMEIIKEDKLVENAATVGAYFLSKLQEIGLKNARGKGLMIAFDVDEQDTFYKKLSEKILCLKCGNQSIRFRPHLTFSKEDVDIAIQYIKEVI